MGSSNSETGNEDRISDDVGSDANVVVVDLADDGRVALAHKHKRARGEFPWAHTHGSCCCKYENDVVDFIIGGDISLRAKGGTQFKELLQSMTNGYSPPLTRTILRHIVELYLIVGPLLVTFFSSLNVTISLTLDGWSNHNLKGFYVVIGHWINIITTKSKSLLLIIIDVASGRGVGVRIAKALFEHLRGMGLKVLPKLLNVVNDNSSNATTIVKHMFQLINAVVGYEQMRPCNHVRCTNHSVQLTVLKVLVRIKDINAQLRQVLVCIRGSKTMRQAYHRKANLVGFASK
ncbi:unnamed protein product [Sphagnum balticum]